MPITDVTVTCTPGSFTTAIRHRLQSLIGMCNAGVLVIGLHQSSAARVATFATPSGRPRFKRGQEADNDQKRTPQSLQTVYVNKSTRSHRSQPPAGAEHGCSSHIPPAVWHGPCTGRPARLMSASLKFIAPGITVDATSQPEFDRCECPPLSKYCTSLIICYRQSARADSRCCKILPICRSSEKDGTN